MGESKVNFRGTEADADIPLGGVKEQKHEEYVSGESEIDGEVLKNAIKWRHLRSADDYERRRDL